jgi:hypothetical protein
VVHFRSWFTAARGSLLRGLRHVATILGWRSSYSDFWPSCEPFRDLELPMIHPIGEPETTSPGSQDLILGHPLPPSCASGAPSKTICSYSPPSAVEVLAYGAIVTASITQGAHNPRRTLPRSMFRKLQKAIFVLACRRLCHTDDPIGFRFPCGGTFSGGDAFLAYAISL